MSINKTISHFKAFLLFTLVNIPKINLISVPGYDQGLRLDDILLTVFLISAGFSNKIQLLNKARVKSLILFMFVSVLLSFYLGRETGFGSVIFLLRWIEYFLLINLYGPLIKSSQFHTLVKSTIILQAIIIAFQTINGIPRPFGTMAGPWEVSIILLLLAPLLIEKGKNIFWMGITLSAVILTKTKTAYVVLALYFLILIIRKFPKFKWIIISSVIVLILEFRLYWIEIYQITKESLYPFIAKAYSGGNPESINFYDLLGGTLPPSIAMRINMWSEMLIKHISYSLYPLVWFIGIGPGNGGIIVDSLYIRLLFEFGLIGTFLFFRWFIYILKKLNLLQIICVLVFSTTIDIVTSSKVMTVITLIYLYQKNNGNNNFHLLLSSK